MIVATINSIHHGDDDDEGDDDADVVVAVVDSSQEQVVVGNSQARVVVDNNLAPGVVDSSRALVVVDNSQAPMVDNICCDMDRNSSSFNCYENWIFENEWNSSVLVEDNWNVDSAMQVVYKARYYKKAFER